MDFFEMEALVTKLTSLQLYAVCHYNKVHPISKLLATGIAIQVTFSGRWQFDREAAQCVCR